MPWVRAISGRSMDELEIKLFRLGKQQEGFGQ